ncbi:MAG: hypothetical protein HY664_05850 [Chloroflexi bacterium]|nr:hypothetical protein [Chloroflexota bacterium]
MSRRAGLGAFFTNLRQPMPWPTKIRLLIANNWRKIRTGSDCCGHPGEPGC